MDNDPDFILHAIHDENISTREYLEQRIIGEVRLCEEKINDIRANVLRIEEAMVEFRRAYEQAHEELRKEVILAAQHDRETTAVSADRRWLIAMMSSMVLVILALVIFTLEHFRV